MCTTMEGKRRTMGSDTYFIGNDDVTTFKGWDPKQRPSGENARAAKLNRELVVEIKARLAKGESAPSIAKDMPVNADQINRIRRGLVWAHVK